MAQYTQDQINAAYSSAKASGMSDADIFDAGAKNFGVTQDQFNLASQAYAPAPAEAPVASAPAPAASGWEGGRDLTANEIGLAKSWSVGKTSQEAAQQASGMGLTQKQLGQIYGWSAEDSALGGYGTEGGLKQPYHDYTYDAQKGWSRDAKKPPTTGINLSQLQGMTRWEVSPNETVRSQLQQIIADDSPLMQQARARAMQQSNARGLLNSSMAATAGESALYDAAMPIATQDAATYARAGEFNAGQANTFARDNNQFVRDAYMADFNVQANEWAAQQQWDRDYRMLDRQQQLTLERDAIQNGYQSARDKFAAEQQTLRDDKDIATRLQLGQMDLSGRLASIQPDTSVLRTQMQIEADDARATRQNAQDERKTAQNIQQDDFKTLNQLRSDYAQRVYDLNTKDLSPEKANRALEDLATTYNPQLKALSQKLGYDPDSWIIKPVAAPTPAPAPTPASAVTPPVDSGG